MEDQNNYKQRCQNILNSFRTFKDFPIPGKIFKDICPIIKNPNLLKESIDLFSLALKDIEYDVLVGLDSRGFIFGSGIAFKNKKGLILVRKPGKLPGDTYQVEFKKNYGEDKFSIQTDALDKGQRCVIVDDVLATGGSIIAAAELIKMSGGISVACVLLYEFQALNGRNKIQNYDQNIKVISLTSE